MVKRVDAHPRLKARARQWYYTWAAISGFYRHYLRDPVRLELEIDGERHEGVTAIAQNSDPFTYFAQIPIRICEDIGLDDGTLSLGAPPASGAARHAADRPPHAQQAAARSKHRQIEEFDDVTEATIRSISMRRGRRSPAPSRCRWTATTSASTPS